MFVLPLFSYKRATTTKPAEERCEIFITLSPTNTQIPLEEYIIGVVSGEMPANFHPEALKAQAIAARTYAIYQTNYGEKPILQTTTHQVFQSKEKRQQKWLATFAENEEKITQAVQATANEILTYNKEPITAMFHASSNGRTESAQNFSGNDVPYLQSTTSPEQQASVDEFTLKQLNTKLGTNFTLPQIQAVKMTHNNTKRVETITIAEKEWTGRDFREALGLRSTDFTIELKEGKIQFHTKGYGHGVGMSQHGANELAKKGEEVYDILSHYYSGTDISKVSCPPK
ncbi:stage II sporulation protein D [Lysinibacillus sp. 54212]|uniref:stage II sporulation protein D n=1 Tax=Lysinibacillus sp. 54212 TaxID=3119829 RepID=UPI002FC8D3B0